MPFQVTQRTIKDIINDTKVEIPLHQRPYIWTAKQAEGFLVTIMDGMPTLSLIIYEEVVDAKLVRWLEDGQQRFMTVKRFSNGLLENVKWNGKTFSEFSSEEKNRFENYPLTITIMEGVLYERRVALFQAIQDGTPLTNGQRFHAYSHSPVVMLAKSIMVDSRLTDIFGPSKEDDKKKSLANAVAIASGIAFNNRDAITTSYDILGKNGYLETRINTEDVNSRIEKLVSVYRRADEICPTTATKKKHQWDAGKYTGYILYSMCLPNRNWDADKEMFARFIARVRRDKLAMKILTFKKPSTRNWNSGRWNQGIDNLDNEADVERQLGMSSDNSIDSDEEVYN
jgi:hypothetical protein